MQARQINTVRPLQTLFVAASLCFASLPTGAQPAMSPAATDAARLDALEELLGTETAVTEAAGDATEEAPRRTVLERLDALEEWARQRPARSVGGTGNVDVLELENALHLQALESTQLRRRLDALERGTSPSAGSGTLSLQSEMSRLQREVSSLESRLRRLESRR